MRLVHFGIRMFPKVETWPMGGVLRPSLSCHQLAVSPCLRLWPMLALCPWTAPAPGFPTRGMGPGAPLPRHSDHDCCVLLSHHWVPAWWSWNSLHTGSPRAQPHGQSWPTRWSQQLRVLGAVAPGKRARGAGPPSGQCGAAQRTPQHQEVPLDEQ